MKVTIHPTIPGAEEDRYCWPIRRISWGPTEPHRYAIGTKTQVLRALAPARSPANLDLDETAECFDMDHPAEGEAKIKILMAALDQLQNENEQFRARIEGFEQALYEDGERA